MGIEVFRRHEQDLQVVDVPQDPLPGLGPLGHQHAELGPPGRDLIELRRPARRVRSRPSHVLADLLECQALELPQRGDLGLERPQLVLDGGLLRLLVADLCPQLRDGLRSVLVPRDPPPLDLQIANAHPIGQVGAVRITQRGRQRLVDQDRRHRVEPQAAASRGQAARDPAG